MQPIQLNRRQAHLRRWLSLFIFLLLILNTAPAPAAEPAEVLILPFTIHAENDLAFLRSGIQDMLSTRLTIEGKARPVGRVEAAEAAAGVAEINEKTATELGRKLQADYVVFGSLTVFGGSISTDVKMVNVAEQKTVLSFHETGRNNGDVINHINAFAARINDEVFGVGSQAERPLTPRAPAGEEVDTRRHPESLWREEAGRQVAGPDVRPEEDDDTVAVEAGSDGTDIGEVWRSRYFKTEIRGLGVGDVDGDGSNEVAFMDGTDIFVYRYMGERFIKVREIEGRRGNRLVSIDVADINGNGLAEIFVTSVRPENRGLSSFVLEWDGNGFQRIVEEAGWYYRVVNLPGRGRVLMGQLGGSRRPFSGGIEELQWRAGEYAGVNPQNLPSWVNVYGFGIGDVTSAGRNVTVAFTEREELRIMDPEGEADWKSGEKFGGSATFLEYPAEATASIGEHREMAHLYLPQRILIADLNGDGTNEIVVARNEDAAGRFLSRFRLFRGGRIEGLVWDEFGLATAWKTREFSGHVSDYGVADIDNDGRDELVFSVIQRASSVLSSAKSFIGAQEINP